MDVRGHNVIKAPRFRMADCVVDPLCARLRRRGAGRLGGWAASFRRGGESPGGEGPGGLARYEGCWAEQGGELGNVNNRRREWLFSVNM